MHILLLEALSRVPSERLRQRSRLHIVPARDLELSEQLLQLVWNACFFIAMQLRIILPLIDVLSELGRHVQRLDGTVEVASCSLIAEADVTLAPAFASLQFINLVVKSCQFATEPGIRGTAFGGRLRVYGHLHRGFWPKRILHILLMGHFCGFYNIG